MIKLSNLMQDVQGEDMALFTNIYCILIMYLQCILLTYSTLSLNITNSFLFLSHRSYKTKAFITQPLCSQATHLNLFLLMRYNFILLQRISFCCLANPLLPAYKVRYAGMHMRGRCSSCSKAKRSHVQRMVQQKCRGRLVL